MPSTEQELRYASALRLTPQIRAATIVIAASDARQQWAAAADIVCSGVNDEEALLTAINALPSAGGRILLSDGTFTLSANVSSVRNGVVIFGQGPGTVVTGGTVTLSGTNSAFVGLTVNGAYSGFGSGGSVPDPLHLDNYLEVGQDVGVPTHEQTTVNPGEIKLFQEDGAEFVKISALGGQSFLALGQGAAQSGIIRIPPGQSVYRRNSTDDGDIDALAIIINALDPSGEALAGLPWFREVTMPDSTLAYALRVRDTANNAWLEPQVIHLDAFDVVRSFAEFEDDGISHYVFRADATKFLEVDWSNNAGGYYYKVFAAGAAEDATDHIASFIGEPGGFEAHVIPSGEGVDDKGRMDFLLLNDGFTKVARLRLYDDTTGAERTTVNLTDNELLLYISDGTNSATFSFTPFGTSFSGAGTGDILTLNPVSILMPSLPTSDPSNTGQLFTFAGDAAALATLLGTGAKIAMVSA